MLGAIGGVLDRIHFFEIVEGLMMELEVRRRCGEFTIPLGDCRRAVPRAGVPGPTDVLGRQQIADIGLGLRRQHGGLLWIGV